MYFGAVDTDLGNEILKQTGIDATGYNLSLSAYEVQKIFNDHGNQKTEEKRGQRAIEQDDYLHVPYVVQNADTIVKSDKDYMGKPVIEFFANISSQERMNVTAVVSSKHLDIFVQTMYVNKKSRSLATPTDEQASVNTPGASSGTASTETIVPQTMQQDKTNGQNSDRDTEYLELAKDPARRENYFFLISESRDAAGNVINVPIYINITSQYNQVFLERTPSGLFLAAKISESTLTASLTSGIL